VALTIPLSLLFAFVFMDLRGVRPISSPSAHRLRHQSWTARHHDREHLAPPERAQGHRPSRPARGAARRLEVARPLTFAVIDHHDRLRANLTFQAHRGPAVPADGGDDLARRHRLAPLDAHAAAGAHDFFSSRHPPSERESPLLRWLRRPYVPALRFCLRRPVVPIAVTAGMFALALLAFTFLGKEFLPELDEGDIWLRVKFPIGISLEDANPYVHDIRKRLLTFPEVRVVSPSSGRRTTAPTSMAPTPPSSTSGSSRAASGACGTRARSSRR